MGQITLQIWRVVAILLLMTSWCVAAKADVFVIGSTFTLQAFNSPDSFTEPVTLTAGNHLLDSGAVNLHISIVPDGALGAEWIVLNYTTTNGGPLSSPDAFWGIEKIGIDLSGKSQLISYYQQWTHDGVALAPTSLRFAGTVIATNPIPGELGTGYLSTGHDLVGTFGCSPCFFPAGPFEEWGTELGPFDQLDDVGIPSADVNGFEDALLFQPVPEPSSLVMTCSALVGCIGVRRRLG